MFGSMRLRILLDRGEWTSVIAESDELLTYPPTTGHYLLDVHVARGLARLRMRPGDTARVRPSHATLDEQLRRWCEHTGAVAAVLAEAAWLDGDCEQAGAIAASALDGALASRRHLGIQRLGAVDPSLWPVWWRLSVGCRALAHEVRGDWQAAAALWLSMGMPLEAARARCHLVRWVRSHRSTRRVRTASALAPMPRGSHDDCTTWVFGASGAARIRRHGQRTDHSRDAKLRSWTYSQPGASNRTIATQLSLSPKTIDHHVSAILAKLHVTNRQQAVNRARDVGLIPER